jgi:hypothetical protein
VLWRLHSVLCRADGSSALCCRNTQQAAAWLLAFAAWVAVAILPTSKFCVRPFRVLFLPCMQLQRLPDHTHAGEVVALYHYQEAERLEGPCLVGEAALLQASQPFASRRACHSFAMCSVTGCCNCAACTHACTPQLMLLVHGLAYHAQYNDVRCVRCAGPRGGTANLPMHISHPHQLLVLDAATPRLLSNAEASAADCSESPGAADTGFQG